jgi:hypothetical protein
MADTLPSGETATAVSGPIVESAMKVRVELVPVLEGTPPLELGVVVSVRVAAT